MNIIFILLTILATPCWLSAQKLTIANGTTVKIGVGGAMTDPGIITNHSTTSDNGLIIKTDATWPSVDETVPFKGLKTGNIQNLIVHEVVAFTGSKDDSAERFLIHFGTIVSGLDEILEMRLPI